MPFTIPTLQDQIDQAEAELAARLGVGPLPRRSVLRVIARVMAGLSHSLHGHLEYSADQILPDTADAEFLERHASLRGLTRKAATFASGTVKLTGDEGATIPATARLQRADGAIYETQSAVTLPASGEATVEVVAELPGLAGNAATGTQLTTQAAYPGVSSTATATTAIEGGTDQETDAELRARVVKAWRERPQAGTEEDYVAWALQGAGITRAWAEGNVPQLGAVTVWIVADGNTPTIAATASQIAEVEGIIATRKPITARPRVLVPSLVPLDLSLSVQPDTAAVRSAIEASLADRIRQDASPGGTIRLSRLREAISAAPGELFHTLNLPAADPTAGPGELHTLGEVTWS